jgi:hypothetical protein
MKELEQRNKNVKFYSKLLTKRYGYNWGNIDKKFMVALNDLINESIVMTNNTNNIPELSNTQWRNILNCYIELYKGVEPKNVTNTNLYNSTLKYINYKLFITNKGNNRGNNRRNTNRRNNLNKFKKSFKVYNS